MVSAALVKCENNGLHLFMSAKLRGSAGAAVDVLFTKVAIFLKRV